MFDAFRGSENPATPVNSIYGDFLKSHGGTIIGTYGYGVSPLSEEEAIGAAESFQRAGGKIGVEDTSVPFGGVDFTAEALIAKEKDVNAILPTMDGASNFALMTALEQAGVKLKAVLLSVGYEPDVINSPAWSSLQGAYFLSLARPLLVAQRGHRTDGRRPHEVRTLHQERVPQLRSGLVVARLRSHDRGIAAGGTEPEPGQRRQGVTRHQVVQRQRAVADHHQLLDRLRSRPPPVCLGPASREVRLCADLVEAILWYGLRRHEHSDKFVEDTKRGSRRRRIEGRSDLQTPPTEV